MHYLAHFYLSAGTPGITIGNFIGEIKTIKGPTIYPEDIQNGIYIHNEIDEFTNNHPVVIESRKRLSPKFLKYSGAIIDALYDHLLAASWEEYYSIPLEKFAVNCYHTLLDYQHILPYKAKCMVQQMIVDNWLVNYKTLAGISSAKLKELELIKSTTGTQFANATVDLMDNYSEFKNDFHEFFPELISFVKMLHIKHHLKTGELGGSLIQRKVTA